MGWGKDRVEFFSQINSKWFRIRKRPKFGIANIWRILEFALYKILKLWIMFHKILCSQFIFMHKTNCISFTFILFQILYCVNVIKTCAKRCKIVSDPAVSFLLFYINVYLFLLSITFFFFFYFQIIYQTFILFYFLL